MSDSVPKTPASSDGPKSVPTKIGRYEIQEKLGSGRTGTVYRATDPLIGRVLAIKTFRVDLTPGPTRDRFLQRFYHEARISGGLSHPNIVALFDVGEVDGLPYLVFEHVDGPTLDIVLARSGRLDSAETIRVVEQTAAALDFAHARGIVHRDIRPANIILANDRRIRIADFGIARIEGSQLTQHGEILGTPAYMSPEQIRGHELSAATDLFSLAVCAYEMLTGQRPFVGKTQPEMLEALVYSPPAEPKELRMLGIPSRDFMFVFERALAKDPAHRFTDGASFARALKSCLGVVVPGDEPPPVTRIAIPDPLPAARRQILPPVAPPPPAPYSAKPPARTSASAPSVSSADATMISPQPAESMSATKSGADISAEATLVATVGFDEGLNAKKLGISSADATMVSPASESEPPAGPRLSRQAVESLLSKSSPGGGTLQKTHPGNDKPAASGPLDDLLPPTREMPKLDLPASTVAMPQDPSRTASQPSLPRSGPADKTIIMTESERVAAAKLRDLSASRIPTGPPPPKPAPPPAPHRPSTLRGYSMPPQAPTTTVSAPRPSLLPKVLFGVLALLLLMGAGMLALLWSQAKTPAAVVEKWNDLQIYPESEVDKSPLRNPQFENPSFKVDRTTSVTVSWIVTPDGLVDDPKIIASATPEIDAFVVESVKKWRYEPGLKGGKTVPVRVLRKYTFKPATPEEN